MHSSARQMIQSLGCLPAIARAKETRFVRGRILKPAPVVAIDGTCSCWPAGEAAFTVPTTITIDMSKTVGREICVLLPVTAQGANAIIATHPYGFAEVSKQIYLSPDIIGLPALRRWR